MTSMSRRKRLSEDREKNALNLNVTWKAGTKPGPWTGGETRVSTRDEIIVTLRIWFITFRT